MTIQMIETLMNMAIAERGKAQMNLNVYLANSAGIGEHPDVVGEAYKLVAAVADAQGKVDILNGMAQQIKANVETSENA